jgi:hypothetical protein
MIKFDTVAAFISDNKNSAGYPVSQIISFEGYTTTGDKGASRWKSLGTTGTVSVSPLTNNSPNLSNKDGHEFVLVGEGVIDLNALGGTTQPYIDIAVAAGLTYSQGLTSDVSNDIINIETVSSLVNRANPQLGESLMVAERADGVFDTVTVGTTANVDLPNTFNIIVSTTDATKCFVLRVDKVINVKKFGATGNNSTDDTAAINAAADYYRYLGPNNYLTVGSESPHSAIGVTLYFPASIYRCDGNLWFGTTALYSDFVKNIYALGATIVSHNTGAVALDYSGAYGGRWFGLTVWGDVTDSPSVGLLLARLASAESAGKHRFVECKFLGYYTVSTYYNYGSEVNRWSNSELRNIHATSESTLFFTSSNGSQSITSPNVTLATGYQSSYSDYFTTCDIHYDVESNNVDPAVATNAPVILESVDYGTKFVHCYFDTLQAATDFTPICRLRVDAALSSSQERNEGVSFISSVFENDYDSVIRAEANTSTQHVTIFDCTFSESAPSSGSEIIIETGADFRRYDIQRFLGIDKELVTYGNSGTLLEEVNASGFKSLAVGTTWDYSEATATEVNNWATLDIRVNEGTPRAPEKVLVKVRIKHANAIQDDRKIQIRGSGASNDPADFFEVVPQVASIFTIAEGWVSTAGNGANSTGTHDGAGNAAALTDSTAAFTTNEFVGLVISNTTDGSTGLITANTATTVTATLSGGTDDDWDASDAYSIAFKEGSIQYKVGASMTSLEFDIKVKGYML